MSNKVVTEAVKAWDVEFRVLNIFGEVISELRNVPSEGEWL
jgi:hypothetical protein